MSYVFTCLISWWPGAVSNHRHADFQSVDGRSRSLSINHLQRLPAPSPGSPRHNHGTPNLSSTHSWLTGGNLDLHGAASLTNASTSISILHAISPSLLGLVIGSTPHVRLFSFTDRNKEPKNETFQF